MRALPMLVGLSLLLTLAGCGQWPGSVSADAVAGSPAIDSASAQSASGGPMQRGFASLPDRGELATYQPALTRADGAYTWHRADLSEEHALHAISDGHLHIRTPAGELLDVQYDHAIVHPSGDWTWVGHIAGHDDQQTILTFGERAVFGTIGQPDGQSLRLTTRNGGSWIVETDPSKIAGIDNAATRPTRPDYRIPPKSNAADAFSVGAAQYTSQSAPVVASATTSAATTVDLVLGYTPGFASYYGGTSAAVTRLNYLVDVANTAYVNSQISARVRLVATVAVSYPDNTSNDTTLDQLTGYDSSSNSPTTADPAFSALRAARERYGADLVSMVRSFREPENGGCGLGWLIGGGQSGISAGDEYYGYSVVSDGSDAGTDGKTYYCLDETLAHEMGHNMGAQHDVDAAKGTDGRLDPGDYGAFAYSFGYKNNTYGFYTVMAYGDSGQHIYRIFSDPRSTFCNGQACGTASADNSRTLTNTIPTIAQFRATVFVAAAKVNADVDGDGRSDFLWSQPGIGQFVHWLMNGSTIRATQGFAISSSLSAIGTGDLDGNGHADVVWSDAAGAVYVSLGSGTGYTTRFVYSTGAGWTLAGTCDVNGDGKSDLLWSKPSAGRFVHWIMSGAAIAGSQAYAVNTAFTAIGCGDLDGNGHADVIWKSSTGAVYAWMGSSSGYSSQYVYALSAGWSLVGTGDVNGDGKSDLLWSNPSAGKFVHWVMNGPTIVSSRGFTISSALRAIGTGDYDGNGHADVVWRNSSGDTYVWLGSGDGYTNAFVYRLSTAWVMIPE